MTIRNKKKKKKNCPQWRSDSDSSLVSLQIILFQVKRRNPEESSTQWTTGIAEVQLPIESVLLCRPPPLEFIAGQIRDPGGG